MGAAYGVREPIAVRQESLFGAFGLSLSLHLLVLLAAQIALGFRSEALRQVIAPLTIELFEGSSGGGGAAAGAPVPSAAPPRAAPPPRVESPKPAAKARSPRTIDGVRLATPEDVRARVERLDRLAATSPVEVPAEPVPAPAAPEPAIEESTPTAPEPESAPPAFAFAYEPGIGTVLVRRGSGGRGGGGSGSGGRDGAFRPDTPGYYGRVLGQISIRGRDEDSVYGRIHLFRDDDTLRDYSEDSLFGHSFRHELGGDAVRDFRTGRVQTYGAYLMVTDLFRNGRLSTMSHTVLFVFPREAPGGGALYEVVDDGAGAFRLRGPAGSSLVFDAQSGALRGANGFVVAPPGAVGSPPRVGFRGLHLRIRSVGGNPFLRGRAATVVDARGAECGLTTSDLFVFEGRRESDMFRFRSDRDFFSFLAGRCPWLDLPRPAPETRVARAPSAPPSEEMPNTGGLLPSLLRGFR